MIKVFLGGTCNSSTWREDLIPNLKCEYFNPVVENWTPECQQEELKQRKECDYVLYVITSEMTGVYSIAEVVDDSNKRPESTIFCILSEGFTSGQLKSLYAVSDLVRSNGGFFFHELIEVSDFLNSRLSKVG